MRPIIPSTTALRVFEAAARHLTCTGAADEMFLTQSAVSKQIRSLEDALGVALFVRVNRGLVLTEAGRIYLDEIRPVLAQLAAASARLIARSASARTLTLRILAILGDRWLLPRFPAFVSRHPDIDVQFTSLISHDGRDQLEADGEFRVGEGSWPGYISDYLFGRRMLLVASPELLAGQPPLRQAADVRHHVLLVHYQNAMGWDEFAMAQGFSPPDGTPHRRYEFYSTLIRAAASGMGLALVPAVLVHDELARGELVNPMALGYVARQGYYFLTPERKLAEPAPAAFRAWVLAEAAATRLQHHDTDGPVAGCDHPGPSKTGRQNEPRPEFARQLI